MLVAKKSLIITALLIHSHLSAANELIISTFNKTEDLLTKCVADIIEESFNTKPTIFISENEIAINASNFLLYMRLTTHLINGLYPRVLTEGPVIPNTRGIRDGFILFIKYFDNCEKILNLQSITVEKIKYLIVIIEFSNENCDTIFDIVGKNTSKYDVTYIIKRPGDDDFDIVTFIPQMNATTCTIQYNVPATLLSTCKSEDNHDVFPLKKPQDLMKCPFKVGMTALFPFSKVNKTSKQTFDPLYEQEGSDFETLKIMAQYFNFTVQFNYVARNERKHEINTSFITFLLNGSFDVCAGGLYQMHYYGVTVDYSGVYGRQTIMWVYPVSRDIRSWQNLVSKLNGLYIFIILYACYSITWYIFCKYDEQAISITNLLLYTWGALIGTSSLQEAISLKQKILNIFYLVLCIHLSAYIGIQFYSFLTIVGPPMTYKTNADIIESGKKAYLIPYTKYFVHDYAYETIANSSEDCATFPICGEKMLKYNGITVLIDSEFYLLQTKTAIHDEARTLRVTDNIITVYHDMLLRKDVPINKKFRKVMTRLEEAGIGQKLYKDAMGILTIAKAESAIKNIMSYSYVCELGCSITLAQTAGAFYLWFIGCGLSFCAFVIELMFRRERRIRDIELHID